MPFSLLLLMAMLVVTVMVKGVTCRGVGTLLMSSLGCYMPFSNVPMVLLKIVDIGPFTFIRVRSGVMGCFVAGVC